MDGHAKKTQYREVRYVSQCPRGIQAHFVGDQSTWFLYRGFDYYRQGPGYTN